MKLQLSLTKMLEKKHHVKDLKAAKAEYKGSKGFNLKPQVIASNKL